MTVIICLLSLILLLIFPEHCSVFARNAIKIWGLDVVPSLFPYMVLCRLLSETLRKKAIPAVYSVSLLGSLGGSPSGASIISCYAGSLSHRSIRALYALTGAISPMFLIGTVSSWLRNPKAGLLLAIAQICGAILCSVCTLTLFPLKNQARVPCTASFAHSDPIRESISAVFSIGGYIVIFSVLSGICSLIPCLSEGSNAIIHSLLEAAGGMNRLCALSISLKWKTLLLSAVSSFGGFSILFQNLLFLRPLGMDVKSLLPIALFRSACTAGAILLLYPLIIA